tara:strand:- start:1083 stop:2414 length:1332 start_codon:yes stop_codon:yes gene_type:complete
MLRTADNVFSIVLDDNASTTANLPAVGTVVTPANTPAGSVVIVDMGMRRIGATTPTGGGYDKVDRYRIVQSKGAGKQLMISPEITKASATLSTSRHTAAVQQVSVVGYNGTTGALPIANSTDFFIKIRKNDNDAANRSQPMSLFAGPVKTSATATQIELANALVKNGIANFRDEPANNYLTFSALSSNAGAAVTGTAVNLVWTKGSREVTSAAVNKTITNVVAGTFVKVAAATTTSVYKVKSFVQGSATTKAIITLDYAFQEESVTVARATNMMITKALAEAAGATAGVRMTGVQANFDVNAFRDYYVNRFSVAFSDVSTLVTTTGARTGSGMFQQVAMDEYMSYGFEGMNGMLGVPPAMRDQDVKIPGTGTATALTSRYSCLEISWTESIQGLVSLQGGKGSVLVYVNLGAQNPLGLLGNASTGYELVHGVLALGANIVDMT